MWSGAGLGGRKVIIFLNIYRVWVMVMISHIVFNIIANRQKGRNFFLKAKHGHE